jgi:hypothetical protein
MADHEWGSVCAAGKVGPRRKNFTTTVNELPSADVSTVKE